MCVFFRKIGRIGIVILFLISVIITGLLSHMKLNEQMKYTDIYLGKIVNTNKNYITYKDISGNLQTYYAYDFYAYDTNIENGSEYLYKADKTIKRKMAVSEGVMFISACIIMIIMVCAPGGDGLPGA